MRRSVALTGMAIALVIGFAGASAMQEGGMGIPEAKKDPVLDKLAGEWAFEGNMFSMGQPIAFTAESRFEWVLGNQFLLERSKQTMKGMPMTFEWITLSKASGDGTYKQWFFDQMGMAVEGAGKEADGALAWEMKSPMGDGRSRFSFGEDGSVTSTGEMKMHGQEEWMKSMDMKGKKKEAE